MSAAVSTAVSTLIAINLALFTLFPFDMANAAVPHLEEALKLPIENRVQALQAQGSVTVESLGKIAFDKSQSLNTRWRSLTAMARMNPKKAKPFIQRALKSNEWFMRNAAVVSLPSLDRRFALEWSEKLISDPALVVRTSAVQNILKLGGTRSEHLLWQKLNARENFRNGESLWIRRHIAKTLAEFAKPGQEIRYIQMLNDRDQRLHPFAIRALERVSGHQLKDPAKTLTSRRDQWLEWWQTAKARTTTGS